MNQEKRLEDLLPAVDYQRIFNDEGCRVRGVSYDSRDMDPGQVFVAIRGSDFDGHDFIKDAYDAGACAVVGEEQFNPERHPGTNYVRVKDSRKALAVLSSRFYDDPTEDLFVVGVTGTNGKTTTVHFTRGVLGEQSTDLISTIGSAGVNSLKEPVTTPESPEVHREAFKALRAGKENFVVEVSSHGLAMERVGQVDFDVGIFTNLTRDHLDFHETMKNYGEAKLKLFRNLSQEDVAIVNEDDDFAETITRETVAETISFGLSSSSDVYADRVERTKEGVSFEARTPWGEGYFSLKYFGAYNVYNALPAITVGALRGRDIPELQEVISSSGLLPGRMERVTTAKGADIFIDFAHNPGGLRESLKELNRLYTNVKVIFGCGGQSDRGKRPEMGEIGVSLADEVILTSDNPKSEDPLDIVTEIERGIPRDFNYEVILDRKEAIKVEIDRLGPDDALLIAGKGHERYQVFDDETIEYNDLEYVKRLIQD